MNEQSLQFNSNWVGSGEEKNEKGENRNEEKLLTLNDSRGWYWWLMIAYTHIRALKISSILSFFLLQRNLPILCFDLFLFLCFWARFWWWCEWWKRFVNMKAKTWKGMKLWMEFSWSKQTMYVVMSKLCLNLRAFKNSVTIKIF